MPSTPAHSTVSTPRMKDVLYAAAKPLVMVGEGRRSHRFDTTQAIHFAPTPESVAIPEPPVEDLPEFYDEEERIRALGSAKELAVAALADESGDYDGQIPPPCLSCCTTTADAAASDTDNEVETEFSPEVFNRMSSKKLNSLVGQRVNRELSRGSTITKETSFTVDKGIVSFGSFLTAKALTKPSKDSDRPVPLVTYLPPSPLFTFDGKLGVDCMAFKLDFTDKLHNIVPRFFLADGEKLDKRAQEILKKGMSYASQIDLFGPEDIGVTTLPTEEISEAHKDLLS
ncbi:hypothetical protein ACSSS7_001872 [Eimeria intestinalis]